MEKLDLDGKPYVYGDKMSIRQYYSHGGPGWDWRWFHPDYNPKTRQVENDKPYLEKESNDTSREI